MKRPNNRQYTITAEIPHRFKLPSTPNDEREVANLQIEITFTHTSGSPAVMYQRNGDPGWPADPDEIEVIDARLIDGDGLNPTPEQLIEIAVDWINDEGFNLACVAVSDEAIGDADAAADADYEAKRDREMERD